MKDNRLLGLSQATIKRLEEHYRQHPTRRRLEEVVVAKPKRGLVFEDLPPNAQECINRMSIKDGKIDQTIKANWMASVVSYQRLYPDRYESLVNNILV